MPQGGRFRMQQHLRLCQVAELGLLHVSGVADSEDPLVPHHAQELVHLNSTRVAFNWALLNLCRCRLCKKSGVTTNSSSAVVMTAQDADRGMHQHHGRVEGFTWM